MLYFCENTVRRPWGDSLFAKLHIFENFRETISVSTLGAFTLLYDHSEILSTSVFWTLVTTEEGEED